MKRSLVLGSIRGIGFATALGVLPGAVQAQSAPAASTSPTLDRAPPEDDVSQQDVGHPVERHFTLSADAGAAYVAVAGISTFGGIFSLSFMSDRTLPNLGGGLYGFVGETEDGFAARQVGAQFDVRCFFGDRVWAGGQGRVGWMGVDRFTAGPAHAMTFAIAGRLGVDVVHASGFAMAIGLQPEATLAMELAPREPVSSVLSIGTFLQLRYRFARDDDPRVASAGTVPF